MSKKAVTERLIGDLPLTTPEQAQASIAADETLLISGFGSVGYPKELPVALRESGRDLSLTVVSGGSVGEEIDTQLVEAGMISRRFPYQARPEARASINDNTIAFHDRNISQLGDEVRYGHLIESGTGVFEAVAVGEDWFIPSTSIGQTPAFVEAADRLILEVNEAQPIELQEFHDVFLREDPPDRTPIPIQSAGSRIGTAKIHFAPEKLEAVIPTNAPDTPYSFREPTSDDREIGRHLAKFVKSEIGQCPVFENSVHVQFGVGSLGNALMSELDRVDFEDRDLYYFGEVIQDGLLEMIREGRLQAASATSLALSKDGQQHLFANVDQYSEDIIIRPADISNNSSLIERFGLIAVNSALEVDIYGHVNSTHLNGTTMINGIGGSGDFTRNALVSIIALPSKTESGISRVVPLAPHVDHTEHDVDVIITEQGVADLRGCSPRERADLIVQQCAHPTTRDDLEEYLESGRSHPGHINHDFSALQVWKNRRNS